MSSLCFFSALKYLPLAEATAINYGTPILVIILAVVFLGERMTRPRIALVLAGIAGMFLIVRPGSVVFQGAALLALGSAVFYGVFQILTRMLAGEDSRVLLFYPALVGTVMLTALLPWLGIGYRDAWSDVVFIGVAGMLGTFGHFLFILAFQRAPASALSPFTYMQLVFATLDRLGRVRQFSRCVDDRRHGGDRRQRPPDHAARAPAREGRRGAAGGRLSRGAQVGSAMVSGAWDDASAARPDMCRPHGPSISIRGKHERRPTRTKPRIGFIGLGLMGHGMAKNVVTKGYPLTVCAHRNRKPLEDLLAAGAKEVKTHADVARRVGHRVPLRHRHAADRADRLRR